MTPRTLRLTFHGRILEQLGDQMYQSPVAAIAELVSNSWDADASEVKILLPEILAEGSEIVVSDNGIGMTLDDCADRYLNVGWGRRGTNPSQKTEKGRPVIGRKGIGKFSGFGIADIIQIETISERTGEKTVFEMDMNELRTNEYAQTTGGEIPTIEYLPPNDSRKSEHGTNVRLRKLKLSRRLSPEGFGKSMARRFLLHQRVDVFNVSVNGNPLPEGYDLENVEFSFPTDYSTDEKPEGMTINDDWGVEQLSNGQTIKWRFVFYHDPIEEEDLRGIAIFANRKMAQKPFFFNISGGIGGQHGMQYMAGQVEADYVDTLNQDIIAPERQRINWEHPETLPFEQWGQDRIKKVLRIWKDRRGEARKREIETRVAGFSDRLNRLQSFEQRTVKQALMKIGSISTLSDSQFQMSCEAILKAWEQGRLHDLIAELSRRDSVTASWLLGLLTEADVLTALGMAEVVKTKLEAIDGLRTLVHRGELENAVRNYIAEKPYILDPKWETYKKETSIRKIMADAADEAGLNIDEQKEGEQNRRIDLALRSNEHLLIVEFMRPGKTADYEHLSKCEHYIRLIQTKVQSLTALGITRISGLVVADNLDRSPALITKIRDLRLHNDILTYDWDSLLNESERTCKEFLNTVGNRAPEDIRLRELRES